MDPLNLFYGWFTAFLGSTGLPYFAEYAFRIIFSIFDLSNIIQYGLPLFDLSWTWLTYLVPSSVTDAVTASTTFIHSDLFIFGTQIFFYFLNLVVSVALVYAAMLALFAMWIFACLIRCVIAIADRIWGNS